MPHIRPFRGVLYNPQKIENIAKVVTRPYDVISPGEQKGYYESHPYNIVRLILGRRYPGDSGRNSQYTRAKSFFADWQKQGILLRDKKEGIYIYSQTFTHKNRRRTCTGFFALLKLEDFADKGILPHEHTFSQPVEDRLKLLKATGANLSPIFALFSDPQGKVNNLLSRYKRDARPYIVLKRDKTLHKLWRMSEKRGILTLKELLKGGQIFIADGHHRYEAALNYKRQMERKKKRPKRAACFDYVMTCLVATADPGLTILPTHRVLSLKGDFKPEEIIGNLRRSFKVRRFYAPGELFSYMDESRPSHCVFGAYFGKNKFWGLKLDKSTGKGKMNVSQGLEVTILHTLIIEHILNIGPFEESTYYTRDDREAVSLVDKGKYQMAFFLRPATVTAVKRIARAGERMPHKSTYFYPKLLTGLVINKL